MAQQFDTHRKEVISFIDLPLTLQANLVWGLNVRSAFPRHIHDSYCIGIIDYGVRLIEGKGPAQTICQNELFILNPGVPHSCKTDTLQGHDYRVINIKPQAMTKAAAQIWPGNDLLPLFKCTKISDPDIRKRVELFFWGVDCSEPADKEDSLLTLLTEIILRFSNQPPPVYAAKGGHQVVKNVKRYIQTYFPEKITLGKLSAIARLSPFYLQRLFLKEMGITPNEYLINVRLHHAIQYLHQGASILEVSLSTGFSDQSHFTKSFKRIMGITPGKYLNSHRIVIR
jgi:AraC-like DNA-binding protein